MPLEPAEDPQVAPKRVDAQPAKIDEDDDYRESEDEDYNPAAVAESGSDESDAEDKEDAASANYAELQGSGGLIKTRAQRRAEEEAAAAAKTSVVGTASVDVDALWAEMNNPSSGSPTPAPKPAPKPASKNDSAAEPAVAAKPVTSAQTALPVPTAESSVVAEKGPAEEYIDIERTFKFAGKVTTEKKRVLRSSAEGQQYLKEKAMPLEPRRGPVKRKMSLLEEYQAGKTKKITTLEKSRLDWLGFVDSEGIQADLKKHNKSGYLDKQGFLARVEHHVDQDLRSHRQK